MKALYVILVLIIPVSSYAQDFNVIFISDSLKTNAHVVKRYDERILEIKSPGKATEHERHVYTILDEEGDGYGKYMSHYDKLISINYITGKLYNPAGKEIKHVKTKDMQDVSAGDQESLITDDRYKINDFYNRTYPYTVDYEEEDDLNGILGFGNWFPLSAPGMSVQVSRYVIIAPRDYQIRYKSFRCPVAPVITENGNKKTYTWEIRNLPAITTENSGPVWGELVPVVMFGPSDFEAEGYKGNMNTWENYGKFIYQLVKGRDALPDDIKKKVHALTDNLKDEKEKVYVLYDFLQKNTRYISIQLGIGGWQPFDANYVASKRYGDCKALSNYMIALLKEAGITGKYVNVSAGRDAYPMVEDFPSFQFNHVISCVPLNKDTIWLECTSQTECPGYMGAFTGNRKAILIDEQGGHVVRTPSYSLSDNLQLRIINAVIDENGNLVADINSNYKAVRQELAHDLIYSAAKEQRDKYLNEMFNLPTYVVTKSNYEEQKGPIPVVREYLSISSPNYANTSGKRLFITPNLFTKSNVRLPANAQRKYDLINRDAYRDIDSIILKIPPGYQPESVPSDIKTETAFGKYVCSTKVFEDEIIYYRLYEQYSGRFPASDYTDMAKFYEQLYKADRNRVVLVKKE
jgi:hypothetical protein